MKWRAIVILVLLFWYGADGIAADAPIAGRLVWSKLPSLSGLAEDTLDVVGAFVGTHNGALIIAGGNKADGGGLTDHITVLLQDDEGIWSLRSESDWRLPQPLAFGAAVTTPGGVILVGGTDARAASKTVFCLTWNPTSGKIDLKPMPPLPFALSHSSGALLGNTIYITGARGPKGQDRCFLSLDLSESNAGWRKMEPWPGPARTLPLTACQNDGANNCFYLFAGRGDDGAVLTDAYKYNPKTSAWNRLGGTVTSDGLALRITSADAAVSYGDSHLFVFDDGHDSDTAGHVWSYHTITDTWVAFGEMPTKLEGIETVRRQDQILLLGRSFGPEVLSAYTVDVRRKMRPFGTLNTVALVLYLVSLVAMGFFFSRREKSTKDFFIGGRRIPWWAAGLSIFGTQLSSISFLAIPAKVYMTDWLYYATLFCIVAVQPIVIYFYLPFFRRLDVTTAYEYLEKRFNVAVRLFGSISFILFQCGRMMIVLFLPALALSAVTGISTHVCILVMGVLATLYTVLGGIEAVIWTDVLQVFVLLGAALAKKERSSSGHTGRG